MYTDQINLVIKYLKTFLLWMLLYFVIYNVLKWKIDLYNPVLTLLSARKELLVWVSVYYLIRLYIQKQLNIYRYVSDGLLEFMVVLLAVLIAYSFVMSFVDWLGIKWFILAVRYEFLWYIIFVICYVIGSKINVTEIKRLDYRYTNIIKRMLVLSIVWYIAIIFKPQALKPLWYDYNVYEGKIGSKPPAAYYSDLDHGAVRNQFLFERPIYFGFWLIVFWPMFFLLELKWKKTKDTWLWWGLYILAIGSTLWRGAWISFFGQNIILIYILYHDRVDEFVKRFKKYRWIFLIWIWGVAVIFVYALFGWWRRFSTTWHLNALVQSVKYFGNAPIFGNWPWAAGPASHRLAPASAQKFAIPGQEDLKWFNPENQYLQTLIQFGIVGSIFWFIIYIYMNIVWLSFALPRLRKKLSKIDNLFVTSTLNKTVYNTIVGLSLWIVWLSIMWFFLGSFSEYTSVYPAMVLLAINLSTIRYWQDNYNNK